MQYECPQRSAALPPLGPAPSLLSAALTLVCAPSLSHRHFHWQNPEGEKKKKKRNLILEASSETQGLAAAAGHQNRASTRHITGKSIPI